MGMYTGLRMKAIVKPEYREMIADINRHEKEWSDFTEQFPFLEDFASHFRASFIPFGGLSYMPDEWDEDIHIAAASFQRQFNEETGYWAFNCSLKNYESEIEVFLSTVANIILESSHHIEVLYEEWEHGELYELRDGHILQIGVTETKYRDTDQDEQELSDWWEWQQGEEG